MLLVYIEHDHPEYLDGVLTGISSEDKSALFDDIEDEDGMTLVMVLARDHPKYLDGALAGITPKSKFALLKKQFNGEEEWTPTKTIIICKGWTAAMFLAKNHPEYLPNVLAGLKPEDKLSLLKIKSKHDGTAVMLLAMATEYHTISNNLHLRCLNLLLEDLSLISQISVLFESVDISQISVLFESVDKRGKCAYDYISGALRVTLTAGLSPEKESIVQPIVNALIDIKKPTADEISACSVLAKHKTVQNDMVNYLIKHKAKYQSQAGSFLQRTSPLATILSSDNFNRLKDAFRPSASSSSSYAWNLLSPKSPRAKTNNTASSGARPSQASKYKKD